MTKCLNKDGSSFAAPPWAHLNTVRLGRLKPGICFAPAPPWERRRPRRLPALASPFGSPSREGLMLSALAQHVMIEPIQAGH